MIIRDPLPTELTETERRFGCWVVTGDEIEPGDVAVLLGVPVRIDRLEPYEGLIEQPAGSRDAYALGQPKAYVVVTPHQRFRILPRPT